MKTYKMNLTFQGHQTWFNEIINDTILEVKNELPDITVRCSDGFFHTYKQILIMFDRDFRSALSTNPEIKTVSINLTKATMEKALAMDHLKPNSIITNGSPVIKEVKVEVPISEKDEPTIHNHHIQKNISLENQVNHRFQDDAGNVGNLPAEEPIQLPEEIRPDQRLIAFDHPQQLQDAVDVDKASAPIEEPTSMPSENPLIKETDDFINNMHNEVEKINSELAQKAAKDYLGCPTIGKCDKKFKKHTSKQMTVRVIELHLFKAHFDTCNELNIKVKDLYKRSKCFQCQKTIIGKIKQRKHILIVHKPFEELIQSHLSLHYNTKRRHTMPTSMNSVKNVDDSIQAIINQDLMDDDSDDEDEQQNSENAQPQNAIETQNLADDENLMEIQKSLTGLLDEDSDSDEDEEYNL